MDNNNSIGTCATRATNATTDILREVNDTAFDQIIDTDHNTVVSAVTESTNYASPQHSKESSITPGNVTFRRGSPPPPLSTQMDLDSEEDEDDIELGSNGTMDDIQDEETSVHSQEINSHNMTMSNSSPRHGPTLEDKVTVDKRGREVQQSNAEDHANEEEEEEEVEGRGVNL